MAADVPDVISSAGGLLYDRRCAGWDVAVGVPAPCDARPLTILGLTIMECSQDAATEVMIEGAVGLAIAPDRFAHDDSARGDALYAARSGDVEVVMWGDEPPTDIRGPVDVVAYRLSRAAKAFKAQALSAAGLSERDVGDVERLFRFGLRPSHSDLFIVT